MKFLFFSFAALLLVACSTPYKQITDIYKDPKGNFFVQSCTIKENILMAKYTDYNECEDRPLEVREPLKKFDYQK